MAKLSNTEESCRELGLLSGFEPQACDVLYRTALDLLTTRSTLRRLLNVATGEELYFYCAVTAFGRFVAKYRDAACIRCGEQSECFNWFLQACFPVRREVILLIQEANIGFERVRKNVYFFRCRKAPSTR